MNIAKENDIKWQYKAFVAGGNDADGFQRTGAGGKVLAISAPLRYIHSQLSVGMFEDIENMLSHPSAELSTEWKQDYNIVVEDQNIQVLSLSFE